VSVATVIDRVVAIPRAAQPLRRRAAQS